MRTQLSLFHVVTVQSCEILLRLAPCMQQQYHSSTTRNGPHNEIDEPVSYNYVLTEIILPKCYIVAKYN